MEVLVVLALFSILGLIIVNVFLLALRSQRQASARQNTLANLRFVTETIARQIRISEIDYDYYTNKTVDSPEDTLALKDQSDKKFVYLLSGEGINLLIEEKGGSQEQAFLTRTDEIKVVNLFFYINPITNPFSEERCDNTLTPNGCQPTVSCTVDSRLRDPGIDPTKIIPTGFCICDKGTGPDNSLCASNYCDPDEKVCLPFNNQPRVTMVLGFESVGTKLEEQKRIFLQTTVSSRLYKR